MKPFTQIHPSRRFWLIGLMAFLPGTGLASDNRVDAMGGMATVLEDETTGLNLFLDGNPAGLVFLSSRDRLDLSSQWFYQVQEGPWGSHRLQAFSSLPRFGQDSIDYGGLMAFPDPHWAFQVDGDILAAQGVPVFAGDTLSPNRYRGLLRAAYSFPLASVGVELLDIQSDGAYDPGLYNPYVGLQSGSDSQNQLLLKAGFITSFPSPAGAPFWQAGGYYSAQLGSSLANQVLNLFYANGSAFPVTQNTTVADSQSLAAEVYYEDPSQAELRFTVLWAQSDNDLEQTAPVQTVPPGTSPLFSTFPKFHSARFQSLTAEGAFRYRVPFSEAENLRFGGNVATTWNDAESFASGGSSQGVSNTATLDACLGAGLESDGDYTLGLQWKSRINFDGRQAPAVDPAGVPSADRSFGFYQLAFGGEKWLSPAWAFRTGLVLEEDPGAPGSSGTLTTSINGGLGLQDVWGRVEFRLVLGQTLDLGDSSNTMGFIGSELSATIFIR